MLTQAGAAEVNALAVELAQFAFERVAVGAFECDAVFPERGLRGADVG